VRLSDIIQRSGHSTNARYLRLVTSIEETDASPGEAATRVQSNASMT
jgi:hypothetical protein